MTAFRQTSLSIIFLLCVLLSASPKIWAQAGGMLNPDMDPADQPFSYFWHPNDTIGAPFAPVATEVTPEGYLYTGFGELMFFVNNPIEPVNHRIKALYKGWLPIIEYQFVHNDVKYRFRMFGADLGGPLKGLPVNFIEIRLVNEGQDMRTGFLTTAFRFTPPANALGDRAEYRFPQRFDYIADKYVAGQDKFNAEWRYAFGKDAVMRDGRMIYAFPTTPKPHQFLISPMDTGLRAVRYFTGEIRDTPNPKLVFHPHTPMGLVMYRIRLKPGESQSLVFKMPLAPLPDPSPEAELVRAADYQQQFDRTVAIWEKLVPPSPSLRFPEQKVHEFLLANTVWDLFAIGQVGDDFIPTDNKFQYNSYQAGLDTNFMDIAFDYMGLHDIARKDLLYALKMQNAEGAFVFPEGLKPGPQLDYWESFGGTLFGWGRHYLLTRDEEFLRQIYPAVLRGFEWEQMMIKKDPLGLIPPATITDDAMLKDARQTGQQLWTMIGLHYAIKLAEAMKKPEDATRFQAEYTRFRAAFEKQLGLQTAKSGGYIPPAMERTLEGNDWDNMLLLHPVPLFEPFDPRVTATIKEVRKTYVEGIIDYVREYPLAREEWPLDLGELAEGAHRDGGYIFDKRRHLHYWHTPTTAMSHLVRGAPEDQELAVKDLYAMLLHTTSTHAPQEWNAFPWSTRDHSRFNLMPDVPSSSKTLELMRHMLVREYRNDLYLFSAVSPEWFQPGQIIEVVDQPTEFGPVSFRSRTSSDFDDSGWVVSISNKFREQPRNLVVRIPWFYQADRAEVDGRAAEIKDGQLTLSPGVKEIRFRGRIKPGTPEMSYRLAVEQYKEEYRRRYEEFRRTGVTAN